MGGGASAPQEELDTQLWPWAPPNESTPAADAALADARRANESAWATLYQWQGARILRESTRRELALAPDASAVLMPRGQQSAAAIATVLSVDEVRIATAYEASDDDYSPAAAGVRAGDLVRRAASTGSFSSMGSSFAGSVRSRSGKDSVRSPTPAQRKKLPRDHGVVVSATGLAARVHWAGEVYNYAAAALPLTALERHRAFDASDAARLERRVQWRVDPERWLAEPRLVDGTCELWLNYQEKVGAAGVENVLVAPGRIAYAVRCAGVRVRVRQAAAWRHGTLEGTDETTGLARVRVDNVDGEELVDAAPGRLERLPRAAARDAPRRVAVLREGALVDAVATGGPGRARLNFEAGGAEADADLNDANHFELPPEIAGVAEWRDRRRAYLATLVRDGATVDDAITGRQLRIDDQLLEIALEAYAEGDDELRAYAEEDCDWTPCGADALPTAGDRVRVDWGRYGVVREPDDDDQDDERVRVEVQDVVRGRPRGDVELIPPDRIGRCAGPARGVRVAVGDVNQLADLLLEPSPRRAEGLHPTAPLLVRAAPGTGKTFLLKQLLYTLATRLERADDGGVPLVPLFVPVQLLVRHRVRANRGGAAAIGAFFAAEAAAGRLDEAECAMVTCALAARAAIVLLDGVDEAAGARDEVARMVLDLARGGHRVVATTRPEGVRLSTFARDDFCIADLAPLTDAQQRRAMACLLGDDPFFEHLLAFSTIRERQDDIYKNFATEEERARLEAFDEVDRTRTASGAFDPGLRVLAGAVQQRAPGEQLRSAVLRDLDSFLAAAEFDQGAEAVATRAVEACATACNHLSVRDTVERLFLLRERREEDHRALWARIALCCDDVFAAAEVAKPAFDALCTKLGEDTKCPVKIAPLKDPVRVHEKATNDYKDRFDDGAPAEACLTDLLRARIEADTAADLDRVVTLLACGLSTSGATLELVRLKNRCKHATPSHFRFFLLNLQLTVEGEKLLVVEIQLHSRELLNYNNQADSHLHYEYFRTELAGHFAKTLKRNLDFMVETRLTLFEEVARVPVLLSLLLVVLGDAPRRFPESVPQLYEFAVQAATQRAKLANAPTVLRRLAVENMQRRRRAFTGAELTANGGPSDGGGLPLLKVLAEGATADQTEYQFVHLTIQEALYGLALRSNDVAGAWATDEEAAAFLNDPFMRNTLALDGAGMGRHFAQLRPAWEFQRNIYHPLTPLGYEGLTRLLIGKPRVTVLDLSHGDPAARDAVSGTLEPFTDLVSLRSLVLHGCRNVGGPLDHLAGCRALALLDLSGTRVCGPALPLAACRSLSTLNLAGCDEVRGLADLATNLPYCSIET